GITLCELQGLETSRREWRCGRGLGRRRGSGARNYNVIGNDNVIPIPQSRERNLVLTCRGRTQSEIPLPRLRDRNDSFVLLSRFDAGLSSIAVITRRRKTGEPLPEPRDRVFNLRRIDERFGRNPRPAGKSQRGAE